MSNIGFYDIQYKANAGQVNLDQAQGIVECFVAGIGNKDSVGDVCASGAFTKSLMRRKPRVVWGHNWNDPIGKVLEIYEVPPNDPRLPGKMKAAGIGGLYARVQFNLNSEKGREAFANVAFFGEEQEWSIGYKTIKAQFDPQNQANILYEVELYEVSPVLHGANQLTGTISVKNAEKGGSAVMPMPSGPSDMLEEDIQRKLQEQLSAQLGGKVKVSSISDNHVMFSREDDEENMYKCRFHHEDGAFMFGQPQRIVMPMTMPQEPKPQQIPQMPMGMPSKPIQPAPTGQTVVVPAALPGGNPQQQPLVRISYSEDGSPKKPEGKPKLVQEEADLANALLQVVKRHGKFNEDSTGVWAGYKKAEENPVAKIGVKCSNCVMYEGEGNCKIIAMDVEPGGKCRFAIIPEGVVVSTPIKKQEMNSEKEQEEVKWLTDIEAKFPEEFLNGELRTALKRKRDAFASSVKMAHISEFESKSLDSNTYFYVPVEPEHAFEIKQAIDPIIDFYRADAYVEDGGIVFTSGVNKDFAEAIDTAVKALGRNLRGAVSRGGRGLAARFNPNAWDGDNDGIVQEGTPYQRPAIPGVNDFFTRGKVNKRKARQAWEQYQREGKPKVEKRQASQAPKPSAPKPTRGEDLTPSAPRPGASSASNRSLTRHSNRDPKIEAQMPDRAENAKRESHEALIQAWEQGMGMPFTPIGRQPGEKGARFTEDWLRGRELGYNDAKARWMGKGTSKRPSTFKENQKSSVDYANWYMNVVGQLGRDKRNRDGRDAQSGYDNDGIEAGVKTFLLDNAPRDLSPDLQKRVNETLKDAGYEPKPYVGLSSGKSKLADNPEYQKLNDNQKKLADIIDESGADWTNVGRQWSDDNELSNQELHDLAYGEANPDDIDDYRQGTDWGFADWAGNRDYIPTADEVEEAFYEDAVDNMTDADFFTAFVNGTKPKGEKLGSDKHIAALKEAILPEEDRAALERRRDNEEQSARDMDRGLSSGARYGDRYDPSRRKPDDYAQINGEPHRPRWDGKQGKWVYDVADDGTSATRVHDWDTPETPAEDHDAFWRSWVRIPYQELLSEYPPVAGEKSPILSRRLRSLVASQSSPYSDGRGGAPFGGKFTRKINRYMDATDPSYAPKLTSQDESYAQAVAETIAKDFSHSDLTIDELAYRFDATPLQIHDILDSVAKEAPETFDGNRGIGDIPKPSKEVEKLRKDRLDLAQEYDTAIKTNRDLLSKRAELVSNHPSTKRADDLEKLRSAKDALRGNGSSRETAEKDLRDLRSEDINVAKAKLKEMMDFEDDESIVEDGKRILADVDLGDGYDRDYGYYEDYVDEAEKELINEYAEKYNLVQKLIDSGEAKDEDEAYEAMSDMGLDGVIDLIDDETLVRLSTDSHAKAIENDINRLRKAESKFDPADPALSDTAKNNRDEASRLKTEAQNAVNASLQDVDVPKRAGTSSIRGLSSGRRESNTDKANIGNAAGYIYNAAGISSGRNTRERGIDLRQGDPVTAGRDLDALAKRTDDLGENFRTLTSSENFPGGAVRFSYAGRMREIYPESGSSFSNAMKVSKDGSVYFVGSDPDAEGLRSFRLDRIEGLVQPVDYEGGLSSGRRRTPTTEELESTLGMKLSRLVMPARLELEESRRKKARTLNQDELGFGGDFYDEDYGIGNQYSGDPQDLEEVLYTSDGEESIASPSKFIGNTVVFSDGRRGVITNSLSEPSARYDHEAVRRNRGYDRIDGAPVIFSPGKAEIMITHDKDGTLLKSPERFVGDFDGTADNGLDVEDNFEPDSPNRFAIEDNKISQETVDDLKKLGKPRRVDQLEPGKLRRVEQRRGLSSGSSKIDINDERTIVDAVRNTINGDKPEFDWRNLRANRQFMSDEEIGREHLDKLKRAITARNEILSAYGIKPSPYRGTNQLDEIDVENLDERTINAIDELDDFINTAYAEFYETVDALDIRKEKLSKYQIERDDAEIAIRQIKAEKVTLENDFNDRDLDEDGDLIISPEYFEAKMEELDDEEKSYGDRLRALDSYIEDEESAIKEFEILGNLADEAELAKNNFGEATPREERRQGLSSGRRGLTDDEIEARNEYMREGMLDQEQRAEDDFRRSFAGEPALDRAKIAVAYREQTGRSANPKDPSFRRFAEEMIDAKRRNEEQAFELARENDRGGLSSGTKRPVGHSAYRDAIKAVQGKKRNEISDEEFNNIIGEWQEFDAESKSNLDKWDKKKSWKERNGEVELTPEPDLTYSIGRTDDGKYAITVAYDYQRNGGQNEQQEEFDEVFDTLEQAKRRVSDDYTTIQYQNREDAIRDGADADEMERLGLSSGARSSGRIEKLAGEMFNEHIGSNDLEDMSTEELADKYGVSDLVAERARKKAQLYIDEAYRDMEDYYSNRPEPTDEELQAMADDYARRGLSSGRNRRNSFTDVKTRNVLRREASDLKTELDNLGEDDDERAYELQSRIDEINDEIEKLIDDEDKLTEVRAKLKRLDPGYGYRNDYDNGNKENIPANIVQAIEEEERLANSVFGYREYNNPTREQILGGLSSGRNRKKG